MTVYVITSGDYSDYAIEALFTDKAKAEAFVYIYNKSHEWDSACIEEYEADAIAVPDGYWFMVTKHSGRVYARAFDGKYSNLTEDVVQDEDFIEPGKYVKTWVFSDSLEKAKKIAIDRFTQYEAKKNGI